jgi:hypothetical protein
MFAESMQLIAGPHTRIVVQKFKVQWFKVGGQRGSESSGFADVKNELGFKAAQRNVIEGDGSYTQREPIEAYGPQFAAENEALRQRVHSRGRCFDDEART